jgi:lysozyme family protein
MTDLAALKSANASRWAKAVVNRQGAFANVAVRLIAPLASQRYKSVEAKTGVPWWFIAVVHERKASQSWTRSLAQGDRWDMVSVHVPQGRGPFASWEEAAIDALANCAPYAARNKDWSVGGTLTKLEEYNGLGYAARGKPSPYIWSGTDQYTAGKYVRDGVYDPEAIDTQPGCAGLLLAMMALDRTITFSGTTVEPAKPSSATPLRAPKIASPSITHPSKGSIGAFVASILSTIFNSRKKRQ